MRSLPGQAAGNCRSWRFCWRPWSLFPLFLFSSCLWKQNKVEEGGYSDIKKCGCTHRARRWTLEHKRTRVTTRKRGGQRRWTRNMLEPAKRGHGEAFGVSLLANCRISVWAPNQRHPTAAAALRACHRATSTAHESRRPVGPHNCADASPPNDKMGNGGHEVGTRAEHLGQGSRHSKLGTPQPLHGSSPTTPP